MWDLGKGMVMIFVARLLGFSTIAQFAVGLSVIAGHNWPVFLRFQGGRGILASLGVILMFSPLLGIVVLAIAYSIAPFKLMSLGVFIGLLSLPVFVHFFPSFFGIHNPERCDDGFSAFNEHGLYQARHWA